MQWGQAFTGVLLYLTASALVGGVSCLVRLAWLPDTSLA